ncbi:MULTISPECIES: hypothetical protein [Chryseobacterium]|uniref:hypothetical protein n=1 Tax=Chryseobacterium TaxID=59732 RepID=UPI00162998EC|nr:MULTISPECIES: hypothetical protein [Chryseobacterium]MDM1555967.1 hypothetical protein [Chryseobacterium indologenes]
MASFIVNGAVFFCFKFFDEFSTGKQHDGCKIEHTFHVLRKQIPFKNINILKTKINKETVYGNIGQDVIGQINMMILNFDRMFIKFD